MTATSQTYHWLKQIPRALLKKDEIPLLGFPPEFPWMQFSKKLGELLELEDLAISQEGPPKWRLTDQLFQGLGSESDIVPLNFVLPPDEGVVTWLMTKPDLKLLMQMMIDFEGKATVAIGEEFVDGFYQFLAIEALNVIAQIDFDKTLSFQMLATQNLPQESSLCLDIVFHLKERAFAGRLVLSDLFYKQWKARYAERVIHAPLEQNLNLILHLEAGRVNLTHQEWNQVKLGDFLLLDACSVNPRTHLNQIKLTIHGLPLFAGEIAENGIKILEYSEYQEGDLQMAQQQDSEGHDDENKELDPDFGADDDELNENMENSDLDLNPENEEEPSESEESFLEEDFDEDLDESELETLDEEFPEDKPVQENWPPPPERRPTKEAAVSEPAVSSHEEAATELPQEQEQQPQSLGAVPLPVVVEVARLQMSLKKLMELQPGNLLDLKIQPENGVDLVVNGRRIARGELLLIGETLGVRILDMG